MSVVLAIALVKLVDPLLLIAAFLGAYPIRRRWWGVLPLGLVVGFMYEGLNRLVAIGPLSDSPWLTLVPACIAGTAHTYLAYLVYRFLMMEWLPNSQPKRSIAIGFMSVAGAFMVIAPGALLATFRPASILAAAISAF